MINKQDVTRFIEDAKLETQEIAIIIMANKDGVSYYVEGNGMKIAAALILVAKKDQNFSNCLGVAAAYFEDKD